MKPISRPLMFVLVVAASQVPLTAFAGEGCTCRFNGGEIAEGQTACIKSPNGMKMARCEKVLNNTSWKMLDIPCPLANSEKIPQSDRQIASLDIAASSSAVRIIGN